MRISSDRSAKMNAVAVVVAVAVAALMGAAVIAMTLFDDDESGYKVTVTVDTMEVADDDGYVYNLMRSTALGNRYYNPETGKFDLPSPSGYAILYGEFTVGSSTNYTDDTQLKKVQTSKVPVSSGDVSVGDVVFNVGNSDSVKMTVFLKLKGTSTADNGSVIDIHDGTPDTSGAVLNIALKEGSNTYELAGNGDSILRGLIRFTVTVTAQ